MSSGCRFEELPLEQIRLPAGKRPHDYSEEDIRAFVRAIEAAGGTMHPALVRPAGPAGDRFDLVFGGLRYAAAQARGETTLPCQIRDLEDADARLTALLEDRAGKTTNLLPLGWQVVEVMEATGLKRSELVDMMPAVAKTTLYEAVGFARAFPEDVFTEVADSREVPLRLARTLGRDALRKVKKIRNAPDREAALGDVLEELRDSAPVDGAERDGQLPLILGSGTVRLDIGRIPNLTFVDLLMTLARTGWHLCRTWIGSREFAGFRPANSGRRQGSVDTSQPASQTG